MSLPTFRSSLAARRQERERRKEREREREREREERADGHTSAENDSSEHTTTSTDTPTVDVKKATSRRRHAVLIASSFFLVSVVFLILTIIGNISRRAVIRDTYFFKLNLSNILPASTPADITFVNSLARSLGLHDFYQVGLWGFCEGYADEGITSCSKPQALYWFDPVEILLNELLAGATIALPADINNILHLIRLASHLMFGFFLTGLCMNVVNVFVTPVVLISRWWSLPIAIWTFLSALLTMAATLIATVMFVIFRNVITSQAGLNIGASLGIQMFAFMWLGTAFSVFGFLTHLGLSCCGASRRDVRTGRRKGSKKAYGDAVVDEKKTSVGSRRRIGFPGLGIARRKTSADVL